MDKGETLTFSRHGCVDSNIRTIVYCAAISREMTLVNLNWADNVALVFKNVCNVVNGAACWQLKNLTEILSCSFVISCLHTFILRNRRKCHMG